MKFKAIQTVTVKIDHDMITVKKGEERELPEIYGLNPSLEVVEEKKAEVKPAKKKVVKKSIFSKSKK